jgi:hypothetical protein
MLHSRRSTVGRRGGALNLHFLGVAISRCLECLRLVARRLRRWGRRSELGDLDFFGSLDHRRQCGGGRCSGGGNVGRWATTATDSTGISAGMRGFRLRRGGWRGT